MAMPAYVLAFVAVATLDYAGAVPSGTSRLVRRRIFRAADPLDRRHDRRARARGLSLRLPDGARRLPDARRARARGGAVARARALGRTFSRRRAARAALARGRCRARRDGNARRLRRRVGLQLRHVHDGDLQDLVRPVLDRDGARPRAAPARLRGSRARPRARCARTRPLSPSRMPVSGAPNDSRFPARAAGAPSRSPRPSSRSDSCCRRRARALGLGCRPDRSRCALPRLHASHARPRRDGGDHLRRARTRARLRDARRGRRRDPNGLARRDARLRNPGHGARGRSRQRARRDRRSLARLYAAAKDSCSRER